MLGILTREWGMVGVDEFSEQMIQESLVWFDILKYFKLKSVPIMCTLIQAVKFAIHTLLND